MRDSPGAAIFDLDGVLTDTAELHYLSWESLARELKLPFDRRANEALRGLSRMASLERLLGHRSGEFSPAQKEDLCRRKNEDYLRRVSRMTPLDLLPGAAALLRGVRAAGLRVGVASSSRNARAVIERLEIEPLLDVIVDGNDAERSKPHPQVFLLAAERLNVAPAQCVVIEDAESGVEAALAAGMKVIGLGPPERVGRAHLCVAGLHEIQVSSVLALLRGR